MTTEQIDSMQSGYVQVIAMTDIAAQLFRLHLFEHDPNLKRLCGSEASVPGRRLTQMIGQAVEGLDRSAALASVLRELSRGCAASRGGSPDYIALGVVFLATLECRLGCALPEHVREAWAAVYGFLAATMQPAEVAA